MAYQININGETFIGRTIPGSAYMRVYRGDNHQCIAAFVPDTASLIGDAPTGKWIDVAPFTQPEWLEKLAPAVLEACRQRLESFQARG